MAEYASYTARAQRLLAALRQHRIPVGQLDMRPYWRGRAFQDYATEPLTIRRAHALEAVLSQMSLLIREDDLIVSNTGRYRLGAIAG